MTALEAALLAGGGLVAGAVNTLAGGGSLLTVPLLVLLGLPGTVANGTNRVGILVQSAVATWRYRAEGVPLPREAAALALPVALGSALGALAISRVADASFERLFAILMLLLLVPTLRATGVPSAARRRWSRPTTALVLFGIGLYGGAFQAGAGVPLLFALSHAGFDLVRANLIKIFAIGGLALVALPIFVWQGQVAWIPAASLAFGFSLGAALGARIAVRGGERWIRFFLALVVVALALRMLGVGFSP